MAQVGKRARDKREQKISDQKKANINCRYVGHKNNKALRHHGCEFHKKTRGQTSGMTDAGIFLAPDMAMKCYDETGLELEYPSYMSCLMKYHEGGMEEGDTIRRSYFVRLSQSPAHTALLRLSFTRILIMSHVSLAITFLMKVQIINNSSANLINVLIYSTQAS